MRNTEPRSTRPTPQLSRRRAVAAVCTLILPRIGQTATQPPDISSQLASIKERIGGRLGVHALDTGSRRRIGFDDASRYAMASTFKLLLAAAVLEQVDRGRLDPEHRVAFGQADMLSHAPATSLQIGRLIADAWRVCARHPLGLGTRNSWPSDPWTLGRMRFASETYDFNKFVPLLARAWPPTYSATR
jgi:hypothetical protein